MKIRNKLFIQIVMAVAIIEMMKLGAGAISNHFGRPDTSHEHGSIHYVGVLSTDKNQWKVDIGEVDRGYGPERIVHLNPPTADGKGFVSYAGITGHDYNADGVWDTIFYGGYKIKRDYGYGIAGYNSVTRLKSGGWKFKPCDGDKDFVKEFTPGQIMFAILELDRAMREIRNPKHIGHAYIWNDEKRECELIEQDDLRPVDEFTKI